MSEQSFQERRMTFRLLGHWQELRGSRTMPSLSEVDFAAIPELHEYSFVIDTCAESRQFYTFHYYGPQLGRLFSGDCTGEYVENVLADNLPLSQCIGAYVRALTEHQPVSHSSDFIESGHQVLFRTTIVPVSANDRDIDYLVGTTNYKKLPL